MPITGPRADRIDKEIALIKSGAMRGDFMRRPGQRGIGQAEQRMIRSLTIQKMTPEERAAYEKQKREAAMADARAKAVISKFKQGGSRTVYLLPGNKPMRDRVPETHKATYEELRRLSLDDENPDQYLNFFRAIPVRSAVGYQLGKFRFNWDARGNIQYVPFSQKTWENFFRHPQRGRWIPNVPFMHKCDAAWEDSWIKNYTAHQQKALRQYPRSDVRYAWSHEIGAWKCKKPKKSTWVKIRKGVVGAVAIVAAVYLGPAALTFVQNAASTMTGGLIPAAGGGAGAGAGAAGAGAAAAGGGSGAVAAATTGQKILSGAKTLVGYVNKARTIKAIAKGEMPPIPIGIGGASFTDWAMIVAKQKIKEEAVDYAMEKGVEYVERKMTEKEEKKLRAEIEAMQREIEKITPPEVKKMPPEPDPELAAPIKRMQAFEEKKQADLEKFVLPAAIVGGALLLGG